MTVAGRRGRPPLSEAQRRAQRLDISRAAVRLFREQGVAATSGEQIAHAAGVSERTFWRSFRVKEGCVEPLLTLTVEAFEATLRSWPPDRGLAEHLHTAYAPADEPTQADLAAVLTVVRLSRDEPGLRATLLLLQERAEATFAEVLGARTGRSPAALGVRVHAAALNAALRVATDDLAWSAVDGITPDAVERHRALLADALQEVGPHPRSASAS